MVVSRIAEGAGVTEVQGWRQSRRGLGTWVDLDRGPAWRLRWLGATRSFLVVVRDRLLWQGEVLLLIEAHQVENVEVGDHELEHVQPVGRGVLSGRGVRNDVVQENGVRVDGVRGGCVLLTEIDVGDHV